MTTETSPPPESGAARRITDGLEPKNWILAVTLLVGWHAAGWAGVGWGVAGALFSAVIPTLFIKYGMRKGYWGDRHVGDRSARVLVLPVILVSVLSGFGLMLAFGAPRAMLALIASMLLTLAVLAAITMAWKISVHQAVSSGACAMLAVTYGPWALPCFALVALVGWSRIELRDHTPAQVVSGTLLGAVIATGTFVLLR
ncbi:hypothetical protein [Streptomyces sp. ODS28]|uniref:hypothetical protein n=1 Tax=Streptomyces sp. ODS28 TaxID=3136688 RepID=UPI0031E665C1